MSSASSIDSYKDTLLAVLSALKPRYVYEWGPGNSTDILASFPTVEHIDSVEHSPNWYEAYLRRKPANVQLMLRTGEEYTRISGRFNEYDLFFVDGIDRPECMKEARKYVKDGGVIVLHDAERPQYQAAIMSFEYSFFTDNGNTCVMTDSEETNKILLGVL